MFCTIYRLYKNAVRLPPDVAKAGGVAGWLRVANRGSSSCQHELFANLYKDSGCRGDALLPELRCPTLKLIKGGVLLSGLEVCGYQAHQHQRWWCVPGHLDDLSLAEGAQHPLTKE